MTRLAHAWAAMGRDRRIAAIASVALLVTMFLPWYGLQSVNPKTKAIYSHNISAFGDVSFVEAAVFLVAAGVLLLLFARAEGREFNMPGGDGAVVTLAGGWAALLIFYRVFDRPDGHGYPVGIQWGFFLAFVAAGSLTFAGWRMRTGERPAMPVRRRRPTPEDPSAAEDGPGSVPGRGRDPVPARERPAPPPGSRGSEEPTGETAPIGVAAARQSLPAAPAGDPPQTRRGRPRYPPRPGEPEQLSFEDHPDES